MKKDFPLSPTGTILLQREFAISIRRVFRENINRVYDYFKKSFPNKESFNIKNDLPHSSISFINNILEKIKFDLSPIVAKYIMLCWSKANKDAAKLLGLGDWINYDERIVDAVQKNTYKYLDKFVSSQQEEIKNILIKGIQSGDRIKTISDKIKDNFQVSSYKSELIARSEIIRTYGISTKQAIINGGVTRKYQWKTSQKENVCNICRPLHNKIFNIGDSSAPMPVTNTHPQCNCGIIPYVEVQ